MFVQDIRISIFEWNQKYLIKYEMGPFEQTYKISLWDVSDLAELEIKVTDIETLKEVSRIFKEMALIQKNLSD